MINSIKSHFYALKYQYEIWMAQNTIRRYKKIIKKHEDKFSIKLEKITQKRDRKVNPFKKYISNIEKRINKYNNKLNNLNYDFE